MAEVFDWNVVDASNNQAPPVGAPEGMAPSTVNDIMRAMMGSIRRDQADTNGALLTTGTAAAYVITPGRTIASLFNGLKFAFRPHVVNDASATLQIGALAATPLIKADGAAVQAGDLTANTVVEVYYSASLTSWVLPGPQASNTITGINQDTSLGFSAGSPGLAIVGNLHVSGGLEARRAVTQLTAAVTLDPGTHANRKLVNVTGGTIVATIGAQPAAPARLWTVGDELTFIHGTAGSVVSVATGTGVEIYLNGTLLVGAFTTSGISSSKFEVVSVEGNTVRFANSN